MDIEELRSKHDHLANRIANLISVFQEETKVTVSQVKITHFLSDALAVPVKTNVEVQLEIL